MSDPTYFRKGFGLKRTIEGKLEEDYSSALLDHVRAAGGRIAAGDVEIRLAREFGFCYGVERAVEYAYEARTKFPDRALFITGEIIHNPGVNGRLRSMGIGFLDGKFGETRRIEDLGPEDVVILPAFGVTLSEMERLRTRGCILVDTTCGSVLNVWKNVEKYAREGFTAVIHGKHQHEETRATASRAAAIEGGRYVVVRDRDEARMVCGTIEGRIGRAEFLERFAKAASPGFDPDRDLERIGLANQTTMLSSESLEIAEMLREAVVRRHGEEEASRRFRSFDTICTATQDRQDAVSDLVSKGIDLALVIGGYNSSNTTHLVEIATARTRAFHIESAACLESSRVLRHQPLGQKGEERVEGWLPEGHARIGVTAGASTPNLAIGQVIARVLELRGIDAAGVLAGESR
jgi:4-hydroxy-3-methylbut-2-enyl diphosphate reductase